MNEIVLEVAALLLALFCLSYSLVARRELYHPLPLNPVRAVRNPHFAFLAMLGTVVLSAAFSVAATLGQSMRVGPGTLEAFNMAFFFHNLLPFFFALYIMDLCGPARTWHASMIAVFSLPTLLGEWLVLSNPATHLCFSIDAALNYTRGSGLWALYGIAAFYAAIVFVYSIHYSGEMPEIDRASALTLIVVSFTGVAVQAVFAVTVELFFEAIAFFGFMALVEHDDDASENNISHRFRSSVIVVIALVFFAVIAMNVTLIQSLSRAQSNQIGDIRLDVIRSDFEDELTEAETRVMRIAMDIENLLDEDPSRALTAQYLEEQRERWQTDGSFMNVFVAGSDWHIVPGFDAPPDLHAAERMWYIGAMEHPGSVYISEPYKDADTGAMCFTVSMMLSNGQAVVGMDLNLSKVQESIMRMTDSADQTAMIVTSDGLIVGYTDMSLVGERAQERLPEYADVLRRVVSSNVHDSFRTELNGQSCMVFSSETRNNWVLILSVDTATLYAESHRQMAMMASVNLLILVVVLIYYMVGKRNRQHTMQALMENERVVNGLAERLRHSAAQILRLSDAQEDPTAVVGEIRESVMQLSALADNMRSYSEILRRQTERAEDQGRRRAAASSAPSRHARNGIIVTLLIAMVAALALCVSSTTNWGSVRLRREADSYENHLNEWLTQQESILYMFTDILSVRPELLDDYDDAVRWMNAIVSKYPDISACYMANPYRDPPVIMNTGWIPEDKERPETRPWYRETERAGSGFSISAPYLDAPTGNYCVTLTRVVYGANNEFLGIFGIDFYLDKLIDVLGESYTQTSYAFLVDANHTIVNHPNADYQMTWNRGVSIQDTEYAETYNGEAITVFRDYTGHLVTGLSCQTPSGFTVLVANRWWSVYGSVIVITLGFVVMFGFGIAVVVLLINRLIRWQAKVNRQLVEAAEAAVNAGRAKSQFLAQMSHEIRTPMNAIIGLDNIALRDPDLPPRTRDQLQKIDASAQHLLSLINDILDMSRIESGRMELKEEEFLFHDFLNQICVIVGGQCADKGLRFEHRLVGRVDETFVGDDLKLKQVLINILGNAVKFTPPPGSVTFTVEQIACDEKGCALRFTMKDTGIGMDRAFIPRLFETFSQEDATTTNHYGGSGLGMAITKSIVEMMGGRIEVDSEKGIGSTFIVTVPLRRGHAAKPAPAIEETPSAEAVSIAGRHVLIAEDIELNAEILTDLLEMEEITSEWAQNGLLAVECFAQSEINHFDAILMDMRMPVMDGVTATREIRKLDRPDAKTVPIIALTANAFEEDLKQCLDAGMDSHLSKPVNTDLLMDTLRRLLP